MESFKVLIELLKKQDKRALEALYEQYGKKFYSYCIRKWHLSEDESWEVIYKTLETLILKAGNYSFASQKDFDGFIFKVLINFLRQWYRQNQLKGNRDTVPVDFSENEEFNNPLIKQLNASSVRDYFLDESGENPGLARLRIALERLDEIDRDLLLLRAQNYTYEEIAILLRIENIQLKVKHHRAKQKLIELLKEPQNI